MAKIAGDIGSERFILTALAQKGVEAYTEIQEIIDNNCFFDINNRSIFQVLANGLNSHEKIDIPTFLSISNDLGYYTQLSSKDNLNYIKAIFSSSIVLENLVKIATKLKKISITYKLQCSLEQAHSKLNNITGNEPIDEILSIVEDQTSNIADHLIDSNDDPQLLYQDIDEHLLHLEENPCDQVGISSGYPMYDYMIGGGFRAGYINLVVARPKSGKSVLALNIGTNIAINNIPILYLDTEMDDELQKNRAVSAFTATSPRDIETGKFSRLAKRDMIYQTMRQYKNIPFRYKRIAGKPFDEILSIIKRWLIKYVGKDDSGKYKPSVIIYDYFKLMSTDDLEGLNEHQALGFQLSKLTDFLGNNKVSCLAFVQANRDGITKETTDIVSQSDRLTWLCASLCLLRKKTSEEIANEGIDRGNRKIIPMDGMRFSEGLNDGDWININMDNFRIYELGTHQQPV